MPYVFLPRVTSRLRLQACLRFHSILRDLKEVTNAICYLAQNYIQFPCGEELQQIKEAIKLIDGSLFPIKAPSGPTEPAYVCLKGYHAINVQAIGDQIMVRRHLLAKWPESTHDSFIFNTRWVLHRH